MEFKNDQFEREASKTLSTLEALKQKLNNNFSTKGAEELNQAIKTVDVSPITKGLEAVQVQFSALQIAGKRVIENIVDAAMSGIANVKNKLMGVVNQIKVGGANRAQNIAQAKFMLEGLGIQWSEIEGDISYGVQDTAYGLDAAAKVASQLVASNIQLGDDMKMALRGISGVAAMSNSSYEEIGHIFTSIAGQGRVMSIQLNQLATRGLNVAAVLAEAMHTTEAEIKDMVSKGKIDFMTFAKAMDDAYGEHAKEANKTFTGALSNTKAALSRLGADIQAQKFETLRTVLLEVTAKLKDLKKALKPVEESINNMIAAVGKLVESFIKSVDIKGIVDKIAPKVQSFCSLVTRVADAWREIREEEKKLNAIVYDNGYTAYYTARAEAFGQSTEEIVEAVDKLAALSDDQLGKFKQNAWDIWTEGKYGNGQERVDALKGDYELTQEYVEKMIELGWDQEKMDEYIAAQRKKRDEQVQVKKRVDSIKTTVKNVLAIFDNLKIVMHNIFSSIVNVVSAAFGGLSESFTNVGLLGAVVNMTAKLAEFTNKIAITKEKADKIRPVAKAIGDIIKTIAKGLYNCIKFLVNFISAAAQNEIIIAIFTAIKKAILGIFDGLKKLYTKLKETGVWDKFVDILKIVGKWLGERIVDGINGLGDIVVSVGGVIVRVFEKIRDKIKDIINNTEEGKNWFVTIKEFFEGGIDISKTWLQKIGDKISNLFGENGESAESIFKNAYDKAVAFGKGLIEGLGSITWDDLKNAGGIVASIATFAAAIQFLGSLASMNFGIGAFFRRLGRFFTSLSGIARAYANRTTAAAVEALGRTILLIALSIVALAWTLAKVPGGEKTVDRAMTIVTSYVALLGVYEIIVAAIKRRWAATAVNKVNLLINARKLALIGILGSIALTLFSVGSFVKATAKGLSGENSDVYSTAIETAIKLYATVISMLIISVFALTKMANKTTGKQSNKALERIGELITAISKSITRLAIMLVLLTMELTKLPKDERSEMAVALAIIAGMCGLLLIVVGVIFGISRKISNREAKSIKTMISIVETITDSIVKLVAILMILTVVIHFSKTSTLIWAVSIVGGLFFALAGMFLLVNKLKVPDPSALRLKMTVFATIAKMMILVILAFSAFALAIGQMNQMGVDAGEFMGIVAVISACVGLLIFIGGWLGSVPNMAAGMYAFGKALQGLGVAFIGIGGGVLALVLAMYLMRKFIDEIDEFYDKLTDKKDIIIDTIVELMEIATVGFIGGFIKSIQSLIKDIDKIVNILIDFLIVLFETLGRSLSDRAGEIADATRILVKGIVQVIVETLVEAIGGILEGLAAAYDELKSKIDNYIHEEEQKDIKKQQGEYKDNIASTYVAYIKSDKSSKTQAEKEAMKQWLSANGYDENGNRTEDWTLETTVQYEDILSFESKTPAQEYAERNSSGFKSYTPFNAKEATEKAKEDAEKAKENTEETKNSIEDIKNKAISMAGDSIDIKSAWENTASNFTDGGSAINNSLVDLENDFLNTDSIENGMDVIGDSAEENATNFAEYQNAVNEKTTALATSFELMAQRIQTTMQTLRDDMQQYGVDVIDGFINGMAGAAAILKLEKATRKACSEVADTITTLFEIESPSKLTERMGKNVMFGLAKGIADKTTAATEAMKNAADASIESMRNTLRRITSESMDGIEQPRITPVLDLDGIREGKYTMQELLDMRREYGIAMLTSSEAQQASKAKVRQWLHIGSNFSDENTVAAINNLNGEVSTLKDAINGMQVVIDGRALVGQISTPMDKALGRKAMAGRRGR